MQEDWFELPKTEDEKEDYSPVSSILSGLQKFFQKNSQKWKGFYFPELETYLDGIEEKLLDENVAQKFDEKEYNALWDTLMYLRGESSIYPKEGHIIAVHGSVKNIYHGMLEWRKSAVSLSY